MKLTQRLTAGALTLVMGAGLFTLPMTARASEQGRRNTALGLGAAAAALLLTQKNKTAGIAAAVGAVVALGRYNESVEHRRDRYGRYDSYDRYDRNSRYDRDSRYDDRSNDRYDGRYDNRSDSRYDNRYDRSSSRDDSRGYYRSRR